jgi:hypothetical protein
MGDRAASVNDGEDSDVRRFQASSLSLATHVLSCVKLNNFTSQFTIEYERNMNLYICGLGMRGAA